MGKQQLIMDKALELFGKQGINDTTVQQIMNECNMSKGAFYLAFTSKDELITALIDRFMIEYTSDIDQMVRNEKGETLLRQFFIYSYHFSLRHQPFTNLYIKEQIHKLNEHLIEKMKYYNQLLNESLYHLVDRLYKHKTEYEKYELVWVIKAFMQIYQKFSFEENGEIDMELFVTSCVEKIDLIATHSKTTFVTEDLMLQIKWNQVKVDELILKKKIMRAMEEIEEPILVQSLQLLHEHLVNKNLPDAVIHGLLQNIQHSIVCKEVRYLYQVYMEQEEHKGASR
ncbi:TetR/AcrR family transcriptional regulator [Pseudogracilibacillus sp. ICA-222130]|uniref:TetR/AcrR family transcriptional regulator n=1 Tax=Pseudogracilibacillus sp. ICA-222130 TaxID=3134655 RepID=UPI0030C52E0E